VPASPQHEDRIVSNDSKFQADSSGRRIMWATGAACVACCTLPWLGLAVGSATLAGLAVYSERAAVLVALLGAALWFWRRSTRRAGPSCDIDGRCKPARREPPPQP
jgi:hypothetical protein